MNHVLAAGVIAEKSGEAAKAGPIGLAVILLLCIASYFLFKSMSKHMRNVRENFPGQAPVQRVKAPLVHPNAVPGTQDPMLGPRATRPRAIDPPVVTDLDRIDPPSEDPTTH